LASRFGESEEVDVVYSDNDLLTEWGHRLSPCHKPGWSPELLLQCNYVSHLVAARRETLSACEAPFEEEVNGSQDWDLCFKLSRVARRVSHVPLVLYHWRARPESVAARGAAAKPWAYEAARRVRARQIAWLDDRLELSADEGPSGFAPPRIRQEHLPELVVVDLRPGKGASGRPVSYPGPVRRASLSGEATPARLRTLCEGGPPGRLFLFLASSSAPPDGDVGAMAAYAIMARVACVWPFASAGIRRAYTVTGDKLAPVVGPRSPFSSYTGNVLTGPLDGLLIERGKLARLLALPWPSAEGNEARGDERLGAALGLCALRIGLRNVAVSEVIYPARFGSVGSASMPEVDPYI
jgi:hypothetical protein